MKSKTILLAVAGYLAACTSLLNAQTDLWGKDGSAWTPASPLPDFSTAGYHRGERPLPVRPAEVSVTDYGAIGDGKTDCTEAFARALTEGAGKVIGIPQGLYLLNDRLRLPDAGTVLAGEGVEKSVLMFQRGLQEIEPTTALTGGGFQTNSWSWSGGLIRMGASGDASNWVAINGAALRGANAITVEDAAGLQVGDECSVQVKDDSDNSLTHYAYRGRPGDIFLIAKYGITLSQPVVIAGIEGTTVTLNRGLRFDLRPEWNPRFGKITNAAREIGIRDFTIRFPERPYRGHWLEDGMNGFEMQGVHNWARNIRIQNCDSGIFVSGTWCTVEGLLIESARKAHDSGNTGHHGVTIYGRDCLLSDFEIRTKFFHDVTVSNNSVGNVFSKGSGIDISIDHHRHAPYENLFTEIHVGEGSRVWSSGGTAGKGLHTASGATFWNLDSKKRFSLPDESFGPPGLVFAGLNAETVRRSSLPEGWHVEKARPDSLKPPNLYLAQLAKRLGSSGAPPAGARERNAFEKWTNTEGTTIEAVFLGKTDRVVKLRLRDGRVYDYPLEKLDKASRALAERFAK